MISNKTYSMRFILVAAIFVIFLHNNSTAQWQVLPSGINEKLVDIVFVNDSTGFVISNSGKILKTVDYGTTWNLLIHLNHIYTTLYALDEDTIFAAGSQLWRSDDAGNTWNYLYTVSDSITALHFFVAEHGLCIRPNISSCTSSQGTVYADNYRMYETFDYGISWQQISQNHSYHTRFRSINNNLLYSSAYNSQGGMHCSPYIIEYAKKTPDNGATWLNIPYYRYVNATAGDSVIYYLHGYPGFGFSIYKHDGNQTTLHTQTNLQDGLMDFAYINFIDAYGFYGKSILKSATSFAIWVQDFTSPYKLNKIYNYDSLSVYAIGDSGIILKKNIISSITPDTSYLLVTDKDTLDFGLTTVGAYKEKSLKLINSCLHILSGTIQSGNEFMLKQPNGTFADSLFYSLDLFGDTTIVIRFLPTAALVVEDSLIITSQNQLDIKVILKGEGSQSTGVPILNVEDKMYVYPNPATNIIYFKFSDSQKFPLRADLYDVSGRIIKSEFLKSNNGTFSTEKTASGSYILVVSNGIEQPVYMKVRILRN